MAPNHLDTPHIDGTGLNPRLPASTASRGPVPSFLDNIAAAEDRRRSSCLRVSIFFWVLVVALVAFLIWG